MVARRALEAQISGIRKMFEAAPPRSINLGLGEPDFDPPAEVVEALCRAVHEGKNHYGPSAGIPALRERLADRYREREPATDRENVLVTASGTEGLMATALALYDPGDEVLVPNPGFVLYGPHARLAGAVPVPYSLPRERGFLPDLGELERLITPHTRAIVVNSPSNPTGAVFPKAIVDGIASLADHHNLTIVSDEVYEEIVYDGPAVSFWGRSDRAVIINSFSKMLATTAGGSATSSLPASSRSRSTRSTTTSWPAPRHRRRPPCSPAWSRTSRPRRWSRSSGSAARSSWTPSSPSRASARFRPPERSTRSPGSTGGRPARKSPRPCCGVA